MDRIREFVVVAAAVVFVAGLAAAPASSPLAENAAVGVDDPDAATPGELQFKNVTATSGLSYTYAREYNATQAMMSNAGVYASDVNNDGWTDVLTIGDDRPALFVNQNGHFERSGALPDLDRSFRAALFFDYDNDGRDDLLLLPKGDEPVMLQNQRGQFVKREVGLNVTLPVPTGASAADFDGDGCTDVFLAQNGNWSDAYPAGLSNYSVGAADNGHHNYLFRGTCGAFENVTTAAGITGTHWTLATSFTDLTGDGHPDIHVANDFNYDYLYVNRGDGSFARKRLGNSTDRNAMSSEIADATGDGRPDVFVTNIYFPSVLDEVVTTTMAGRSRGNNLLANRGNGTFEDVASSANVSIGGWGWAAVAADFNNDGRLDLFHTTRTMNLEKYREVLSASDLRYLRAQVPTFKTPAVWRGTAGGFDTVHAPSRGFDETDGRGVASLDYNHDGRLDLIVADASGSFVVYENAGTGGHALEVDVEGTASTPSLGATVTIEAGHTTSVRVRNSRSDFLSQDSRVLHFGTGNQTEVTVTVTWPDGTQRTFEGIRTGRRITVTPDGRIRTIPLDGSTS